MIQFKAEAFFMQASQSLGNEACTDREKLRPSSVSTISTSLTHNTASREIRNKHILRS